jgi:hypothetical protein
MRAPRFAGSGETRMNALIRHSIWFNRLALAGATILLDAVERGCHRRKIVGIS